LHIGETSTDTLVVCPVWVEKDACYYKSHPLPTHSPATSDICALGWAHTSAAVRVANLFGCGERRDGSIRLGAAAYDYKIALILGCWEGRKRIRVWGREGREKKKYEKVTPPQHCPVPQFSAQ